MNEPQKSSAEIQIELDKAEKRLARVKAEVNKTHDRLQKLVDRQRKLEGGFSSNGEIGRLKFDLEDALRFEKDATAIVIKWVAGKSDDSFGGRPYVLEKVTAKQISIRPAGCGLIDKYRLDGKSVSSWRDQQIDIRATFGIDADSVPPNWKPPK